MNICRRCSCAFDAKAWQVAKSDFLCTPCGKEHKAEWRARRKAAGSPVVSCRMSVEHLREYNAKYFQLDANRERRNANQRNRIHKQGERERQAARRAVRSAVEAGRLVRLPCEVCGDIHTQGHHDDYAKPLSVRWLCLTHHREHHAAATGEQP